MRPAIAPLLLLSLGCTPAADHPTAVDPGPRAAPPPEARALTSADRHLIDWNARYERPRPVDAGDATLLFTADRYWVVGEETITLSLDVWDGSGPIEAIGNVSIRWTGGEATLPLDAAGRARFRPATSGVRQATRFEVELRMELDGAAPQRDTLRFAFTPTAAIPARFTGAVTTAEDPSSDPRGLVLRPALDVTQAGFYIFDANLYDGAGKPVAWGRFKGPLPAGATSFPLRFDRRLLARSAGPYRLGELRGGRVTPEREPAYQRVPSR